MQTRKDDPINFVSEKDLGTNYIEGLTKREWFAGLALQGALASGQHTGHDAVELAILCSKRIVNDLNEEESGIAN